MEEVRLDFLRSDGKEALEKIHSYLRKDIMNHITKTDEDFLKRMQDYQKAVRLYERGIGISKIAKALNYPKATIESWVYRGMKPVYKHKITRKLVKRLEQEGNLTHTEIAKIFGMKPKSVYYGYLKPNKKTGEQFIPSEDTTNFIKTSENPLEFLNYIWKETSREKIENFSKFCEFIKLKEHIPPFKLAKEIEKSYSTIFKWRKNISLPNLLRWLEIYLKLENPKDNHAWLFLNLGINNIPTGQPIEVPKYIGSWNDVKGVIKQLNPLDNGHLVRRMDKEECFGFILGVIVGDAGKHGRNKDSIHLAFSKRYDTNKALGEFFCQCLHKLGFRANRIKDYKNSYKWVSQSSPFFNWIYTVALGLKITETTTFYPIKANWILNSPEKFVKRFLQGMFESDGSVSYESGITCACFPNNYLMGNLLNSFGVNPYFIPIKNGEFKLLELGGIKQLKKLHNVIFVPELKTMKYKIVEKILNANKVNDTGGRLPLEIKGKIIDMIGRDYKTYKIIKRILLDDNFYVSRNTIEHYRRKIKGGDKQ